MIPVAGMVLFSLTGCAGLRFSSSNPDTFSMEEQKKEAMRQQVLAERFSWWPTDAKPAPYKDPKTGGYWWWPEAPGNVMPWGNRGYVYVHKIIFDEQGRPYLLVKRIVRNVKIYFDFDKAGLREDALVPVEEAVRILKGEEALTLLLTGNADARGTEAYNLRLAERRASAVRDAMDAQGIPAARIKILSRGKLDAVAPVTDIVGLQKDRNVHFVLAEVEEIEIPQSAGEPSTGVVEEIRQVETPVKVSVKHYVVGKRDTLWSIAQREYGNGAQWRRLYEFNREKISDPKKLRPGIELEIPIE